MSTPTSTLFRRFIALARDAYVAEHRHSVVTGAAVVLIDQFLADYGRSDVLEPSTFFNRSQLETRVTEKYPDLNNREDKTWKSVGQDLGRALGGFSHDIREHGRRWRVKFNGPTAAFGVRGRTVGLLAVRALIEEVVDPGPLAEELSVGNAGDLIGRCLCCGEPSGEYRIDQRLCAIPGCDSAAVRKEVGDHDLYVSILPERKADYSSPLSPIDRDYLFRVIDDASQDASRWVRTPASPPMNDRAGTRLNDLLPYSYDHLTRAQLSLGVPLVYRAPRLANWARFRDVIVLDLATYQWSNTLKDPKSWAAVNLATGAGIHHLALYTAGNAGVSIGKLAYALNGAVGTTLKIYALVDSDLADDLRSALRAWGVHVVRLPPGDSRILDPATIWSRIASEFAIEEPAPTDRWHVTDGWDGVGIVMYRLMFAEIVRRFQPEYIVVPLGTGSLFVGAHLGLMDATAGLDAGNTSRRPFPTRLIGAVPLGKNIFTTGAYGTSSPGSDIDPAVAPKLVGDYTPLKPCVSHILTKHGARIVEVSRTMQASASRYMGDAAGRQLAAEPSAMIAFAALMGERDQMGLHEIAREIEAPLLRRDRDFSSQSRVLVVNSGFGLIDRAEATFLSAIAGK